MTAQIGEPDTIFYGQVVNRTSGQIDLITSGNMVWVLTRPDGQQITLTATLRALNKGLYSYRLSVPQSSHDLWPVLSDSLSSCRSRRRPRQLQPRLASP